MDDATRLSQILEYRHELRRLAETYLESSQDWLSRSHRSRSEERRRIYYQNYLLMKQRAFDCEAVAGRLKRLLGGRSV